MDGIIECPKHDGRCNEKTGPAEGAPICVNPQTCPARVDGGRVFTEI